MKLHHVVLSIVALTLNTNLALAQDSTAFSYQGRLQDAGMPADGIFDVDFRLWDDPDSGNQVGATNTFNSLPILEGLFTVEVDFGASAFDNNDRWLEITVDGVPLVPRQPVTRAPYAIQTRGIIVDENGRVGVGTNTPGSQLHVESGDSIAIVGHHNGAGGFNSGVYGQSDSTFGSGVNGFALHTSGNNYGGRFGSDSTSGRGVFGQANAASGTTYGVYGQSVSNSGHGVFGEATAISGTTYGGRFESDSTSGFAGYFEGSGNDAVYVENTGDGRGLQAVAPDDTAVWGRTTTGFAGVHGANAGASGRGVYGEASATNGTNFGVFGASSSASGFDFYAAGAGVNYGASSSRRWKNNVVPINDPLDKLALLRGVYFDWDVEHGGMHDVGMIAEEVGAVLPEIVAFEENGIDAVGMDYSKLVPLLVEAVNALRAEQDARIESLRAENDAEIAALRSKAKELTADNNRLATRLEALEQAVQRLASK